uniref:DUF1764 domain-containing protein n=1 Tax=Chlamydomonas leiostraca TaxID=1034604 RepID=A0A7S0RKZ3_9CHLO|mmetsp:Transcript_25268/g.64219  ORF Transcript_25268/g.64219 Transcript_25268/m.64219 type:complete len:138 (+) Transcript_25268:127-540(+)
MKQKRAAEPAPDAKPGAKKAKKEEKPEKLDKKQAKKSTSEIDDIFGAAAPGKAGKKGEEDGALKDIAAKVEEARKAKAAAKKPKVEGSKDDLFGEESKKSRKKTEEGYAIYTEDELGLTKAGGGDTPLCPFDCDCCY